MRRRGFFGAQVIQYPNQGDAFMFFGMSCKSAALPLFFVLACIIASSAGATVHYVKPMGAGAGTSWEDAGPLQATVYAAAAGDEVWVAAGTYKSTQNPVLIMKGGVALYGGFTGVEESADERNWAVNPAIIDGENVRGCVRGANNARLDGFTISNGKWTALGGGLSNDTVSPTVANCTFAENWGGFGGAIYNKNASPVITDCIFSGNNSDWDGGAIYNEMSSPSISGCLFSGNSSLRRGGAMCNNAALPEVTDCVFIENAAAVSGGGMYNEESSPRIVHCRFEGNTAERGGGMYIGEDSAPRVIQCTFTLNVAVFSGGGIFNVSALPTLTACTIVANTSSTGSGGGITNSASALTLSNSLVVDNFAQTEGGGLYNEISAPLVIVNCTVAGNTSNTAGGGGIYNLQSEPELVNSIFWDNQGSGGQVSNVVGTPLLQVKYCCIGGGYAGTGNIDTDPLFEDASSGDYRLQAGSLCIDSGTDVDAPEDDIRGVARPQDEGYDMGAYEYRLEIPHPADTDENFVMVMSEVIAYLLGWQQGTNPMTTAIRAVYLWQVGEYYGYDPEKAPPMCWIPRRP